MRLVVLLAIAAIAAFGALPVAAAPPGTIPLPDGFQPEGIAIGRGNTFFVGSIPTGAVYRGDVRTGEGEVVVPPQTGRAAVGIDVDNRNRVFVAGGPTGDGYVYDGDTGATLAVYDFTSGASFVNDVVVTNDSAWFTDSTQAVLYRVPLGPGGALPGPTDFEVLPLTGDFELAAGFNLNGIDATPNGKTLVVVQTATGLLFTVDPETGVTTEIDLGGETVPFGDGILLKDKTLYVVQNQLNQVAAIDLAPDLSSGTVVSRTGDTSLSVPSTFDAKGNTLYIVNARFGTPPTPTTEYWVTIMPRPK